MATAEDLIGHEAADFRLPSADEREIALSDCLSRGPAVVWFSRGLGCPVCRRNRARLTLNYPMLRELSVEVLEVTPTPVERAAFYFSNYSLVFPYLCDPSRQTAQAYGVELHPVTMWDQAKVMITNPLGAPELMRQVRQGPDPIPEEKAVWSSDEGFFVVDRSGKIRLARVGRMAGLPSQVELERGLRELSA